MEGNLQERHESLNMVASIMFLKGDRNLLAYIL